MILTLIFRDADKPRRLNFRTTDELDAEKQRNIAAQLLRKRLPEMAGETFKLEVDFTK